MKNSILFITLSLIIFPLVANASPQRVYENYLYAIKTNNIDELMKYIDSTKEVTKEELKAALPLVAKQIPENLSFPKEIIVDDIALLYPTGNYYNPETQNEEICNGVIKLKKSSNSWKVKNSYWKCSIK